MKLILFGLAFVAIAAGQQYLPPTVEGVVPAKPDNQYLAPVEAEQVQSEPESQYLPPIEAVEPIEQIAEDGYRYKTVKRIRYRTRRDVSELASAQYLPPSVEDSYGPPPSGPVNAPVEESAVLADDGYRYRTVKRIRYRYRRDVNELPSGQYLAPSQEDDSYSYPAPAPVAAPAPIVQAAPIAPIEVAAPVQISASAPIQQTAELADDGYRYKTVRRIRYRHRRDVNELAAAQYLPPTQEDDSYSYPAPAPVAAPAPIVQAAPIAPIEVAAPVQISASAPILQTAELADDGYRYKTVRRIRYRHRRDVNELAAGQYLPPTQEDDSYSYPAPAPVAAPAPIVQAAPIAPIEVAAPVQISAPAPIQQTAELADDGYRYKTVRRIRYRHRRDVNELAAGQYLPPTQEDGSYSYPAPAPVAAQAPIVQAAPIAPIEVAAPVEISAPAPIQQTAELADDGYRYKTVRRIRYRHRRDVNELAAGQYLPPTQEDDSYSYPAPAPVAAPAPIVQAAPVPQYLPPSVEVAAVEMSTPIQQSAELAKDGYRYKTVKKYKIKRH